MSTEEDRELDALALRSRSGNPEALAVLYRRLAPSVLEYLRRYLGNTEDAEDLLHEAFLRILEGRGRYEGRGRFRSWIFTVATRLAQDRYRQSKRRGRLIQGMTEAISPVTGGDPSAEILHHELNEKVDAALADLPPNYTHVFHLRVREGFSYGEIAAMSGEPEGTLRSRVHHSLKRIRQVLERSGLRSPRRKEEKENPL